MGLLEVADLGYTRDQITTPQLSIAVLLLLLVAVVEQATAVVVALGVMVKEVVVLKIVMRVLPVRVLVSIPELGQDQWEIKELAKVVGVRRAARMAVLEVEQDG
tara:strand:+ start:241 stop:552 length:312 start_codon:yes stop_codon:yes gene_type:complete